MSENFKNLRKDSGMSIGSPEVQRDLAVTAALTLIQSRVLNATGANQLQWELGNLSAYADQIQEALKVKRPTRAAITCGTSKLDRLQKPSLPHSK